MSYSVFFRKILLRCIVVMLPCIAFPFKGEALRFAPIPPDELITHVETTHGKEYIIGRMAHGARIYIDSRHTINSLPREYHGANYIRTANRDRKTHRPIGSFHLSRDAILLVGYDRRACKGNLRYPEQANRCHLPDDHWLSTDGWKNTGHTITVDGGNVKFLVVFSKVVKAGKHVLPGNLSASHAQLGNQPRWIRKGNMYSLFALPIRLDAPPCQWIQGANGLEMICAPIPLPIDPPICLHVETDGQMAPICAPPPILLNQPDEVVE